ncbi:MAG: S-layer homology domain-containing protein [Acidaminococcus intestini]
MGISSLAFAANPFSDVPQGHWAYASFAQLSGSGILEAYPDSTFAGSAP